MPDIYPDTAGVHSAATFNAAMSEIGLDCHLTYAADSWWLLGCVEGHPRRLGIRHEGEAVSMALHLVADWYWTAPELN